MSSSQETAKTQILSIIREYPEDGSYDDILRDLGFHRLVGRALVECQQGRVISTEELRRRVKTWYE